MYRGEHFMSFSVQDWRTSRVRTRSIVSGNPLIRVVYLEILFALQEAGGEISADPEVLADIVGLPQEDIEQCLGPLLKIGASGRGGLIQDGGMLSNARVTEDLRERQEYRKLQSERGKKRAEQLWGDDAVAGTRAERLRLARAKATHTEEQWVALLDFCGRKCLHCGIPEHALDGGKLTKDHIIQISRGGSDGIENLQPLCRNCNHPATRYGDLRLSIPGFTSFIQAIAVNSRAIASAIDSLSFPTPIPSPSPSPTHPPTARTRERRTEVQTEDEDFEKVFWPAYPNKKAKKVARSAWDKAKKENRLPALPELLARLERLKASREWQKDGGAYIPHPATWINADGWHDEPAAAPTASPASQAPSSPALRMRPEVMELPGGRRVWQVRAPDGTVVSKAGWIPRWGPWPMCEANWPAEWGDYPGDEPPQVPPGAQPPPVRPAPSTLFDMEAHAS